MDRNITLEDILAAKENRQARQTAIRRRLALPIVSITINMPGPVKDGVLVRQLCDYAVQEMKAMLPVVAEERNYLATGPEALLAVKAEPAEIKKKAVVIEEAQPFARLLDIDVFSAEGEQFSRQSQGRGRSCLVCDQQAVSCMRERRHSMPEILQAVTKLLLQYQAYATRNVGQAAEKIGALAIEAMLYEVTSTPAPGLVDRVNSGAHQDMDFYTFMASTAALSVTMARCAQAGLMHEGQLPDLLTVLRYIGMEGERAMLSATQGVNTQKGLLFSLGIVAAATGWASKNGQPITSDAILEATAGMVAGIVERELGRAADKEEASRTAGEKLYLRYGVTGIRGEMENGLPAIGNYALPALQRSLADGLSVNDALLEALLVLMVNVEDTTVMNRHDPAKMKDWVKQKVQAVLSSGGMRTPAGRQQVEELDREFITHNVSPGGAADLLAVTWFIHRVLTCYGS